MQDFLWDFFVGFFFEFFLQEICVLCETELSIRYMMKYSNR